jgi:hypothetical protein
MSTPASCLLSRLISAHRRAGSPPLAAWPVWPETRVERAAFAALVGSGLVVEVQGAWFLTERALGPAAYVYTLRMAPTRDSGQRFPKSIFHL